MNKFIRRAIKESKQQGFNVQESVFNISDKGISAYLGTRDGISHTIIYNYDNTSLMLYNSGTRTWTSGLIKTKKLFRKKLHSLILPKSANFFESIRQITISN